MNYELLNRRMAKFFSETSAENLISKFQNLGYDFCEFSTIAEPSWINVINCCDNNIMQVSAIPFDNFWRIPPSTSNKYTKKDPETFRGLFFFVRL